VALAVAAADVEGFLHATGGRRVREVIVVLDFGSQYTQLIARRVREAGVYCEIYPYDANADLLRTLGAKALILSGGPASVYAQGAPKPDPRIFDLGVPLLGICYGMGILAELAGGAVAAAEKREYGAAEVTIEDTEDLFAGFHRGETTRVWMSHGDRLERLPEGWIALARTGNAPLAACADHGRRLFGVQFHPEVVHTARGREIFHNFLFRICGLEATWTMENFLLEQEKRIREQVGRDRIICALSGGVDSAVTAAIVERAVGDGLTCVFVDNGLLRKGEAEAVRAFFAPRFGRRFRYVDARARFLHALRGLVDPEEKRKAVGRTFIEVFESEAAAIPGIAYLAQGTLYPDVIESVSLRGPSATIKSHHNVGGLPERMRLKLVEPLRELFKDEVRSLGEILGLPPEIVQRQPFPGPGLAIRIIGEVTAERLELEREVDAIVVEEIHAAGLQKQTWQAFAVLLPVKSVGVMGDERTYDHVVAVRVVTSVDGMTADWARLPEEVLARLSNRIINEVPGVNRVVYDISSKPPATIEWE